ncbi:MAG: TetR/AcrR family transcriptional regulator [Promicromonosporaceae bacterium]|nr:TetR/AcrR family transcriptional regulator [Promicromonosporaceae bacterium]
MARWEPNARARLAAAALDLFEEHGYDSTTVAQITERAGLTKSSFFRHFTDKREVLFDGEAMTEALVTGVAEAPADVAPLDALTHAFLRTGETMFPPERRPFLARRAAVIRRAPELAEREALKELGLADAVRTALEARGTTPVEARVCAELGGLAFSLAYERWLEAGAEVRFEPLLRRAEREVRAAASQSTR